MTLPKVDLRMHIGQRNIKTAIAATLTALLYFIFDRNPTFACIGAIFGLGSDMPNSRLNGGNRFFGTLFGGFLGMGLFRLYMIFVPEGGMHPALFPFLFVGVVLLILVYVRMFSTNIQKRYAENMKYLEIKNRLLGKLKKTESQAQDLKTHHIYRCPGCGQKIRVPRGKGMIMITCPKCKKEFRKKS